jgi:hypothetical protein
MVAVVVMVGVTERPEDDVTFVTAEEIAETVAEAVAEMAAETMAAAEVEAEEEDEMVKAEMEAEMEAEEEDTPPGEGARGDSKRETQVAMKTSL